MKLTIAASSLSRGLRKVLIGFVKAYQILLAPLLGPACRYQPSCSEYSLEAITAHGAFRGSWYSVCRLVRCRPYGGCGFDPIPGKTRNQVERGS